MWGPTPLLSWDHPLLSGVRLVNYSPAVRLPRQAAVLGPAEAAPVRLARVRSKRYLARVALLAGMFSGS